MQRDRRMRNDTVRALRNAELKTLVTQHEHSDTAKAVIDYAMRRYVWNIPIYVGHSFGVDHYGIFVQHWQAHKSHVAFTLTQDLIG